MFPFRICGSPPWSWMHFASIETVPYQLLAAIERCFHANGRWVSLSPTEIVASAKSKVQRSTSQHPKCKSNP